MMSYDDNGDDDNDDDGEDGVDGDNSDDNDDDDNSSSTQSWNASRSAAGSFFFWITFRPQCFQINPTIF